MFAARNLTTYLIAGIIWLNLFSTGDLLADEKKSNQQQLKKTAAAKPVFTVSKETTYVTGPLRKDGTVDYVAALNAAFSRAVTVENNAAVLLSQAVGPNEIEAWENMPSNLVAEIRTEYFKRLGIAPLPLQGNYFVSLDKLVQRAVVGKDVSDNELTKLESQLHRKVLTAQKEVWEQFDKAQKRTWTAREFPLLAEWLLVNQEPLQLVQQACQRTRYYAPLISGDTEQVPIVAVLLPFLSEYRDLGRALSIRITFNAAQGNADEVIEDSITCHRLGRLIGQGWSLIDSLVGMAIDSLACQANVVAAHYGKLPPDAIEKWRKQLQGLEPLPAVVERINISERFTFLDATMGIIRFGPIVFNGLAEEGDNDDGSLKNFFSKAMLNTMTDWDAVLRNGNRWYDELADAGRMPTYQQRVKAFVEIERKIDKVIKSSKDPKVLLGSLLTNRKRPGTVLSNFVSNILISMLLPAVDKATVAEDRMVMRNRLVDVALGLAAYRHETGQYPAQLAQLVPKHLANIPEDLFVGKPVRYRRKAQGYLLYSVGPNQKDNGGQLERNDVGYQIPVPPQDDR
ncbi:MAG: hypothetical protein VB862_08765 [Pirellulaceae bacterium]